MRPLKWALIQSDCLCGHTETSGRTHTKERPQDTRMQSPASQGELLQKKQICWTSSLQNRQEVSSLCGFSTTPPPDCGIGYSCPRSLTLPVLCSPLSCFFSPCQSFFSLSVWNFLSHSCPRWETQESSSFAGLPRWRRSKESACQTQEMQVRSLSWEDPPGEGNGNLIQCSCLGNPMDGGGWWIIVHGVTESNRTEQWSIHCSSFASPGNQTCCSWLCWTMTLQRPRDPRTWSQQSLGTGTAWAPWTMPKNNSPRRKMGKSPTPTEGKTQVVPEGTTPGHHPTSVSVL